MNHPFSGTGLRTPLLVLCTFLALTWGIATAKDAEEEPPEVPAWLETKIADLPKEKREFLLSEDALGFAGAPVAIYPEDLVAGNVDVAIVGAPLDMGSYYRGAGFGPMAMRNEYGAGGPDMYTMVNPSEELTIVDYGDIAVDNMSTDPSFSSLR